MTLVRAVPAHAEALALIHAAGFPPAERWGLDALTLQLSLPGAYGFVSLLPFPPGKEDASGGFILARVAADEAEILTLAVTPAAQGRGLGRRLLQAALDHAQSNGAASMYLEVSPGNTPALALYNGAGFVPVGHRPRYYPSGGGALVLRCDLIPGAAAAGAHRPAGA